MKILAGILTLTALLLIWAGCASTDSVNVGIGWKKAYPPLTNAPAVLSPETPKLPLEPK